MEIKAALTSEDSRFPEFKIAGSAGADLYSREDKEIDPRGREMIGTGVHVNIPEGYVGLICSRSGLALKEGVIVFNSPSVIDAGYMGELGAVLYNTNNYPYRVNTGDRIAQILFMRVEQVQFIYSTSEEFFSIETDRGARGFGSTGR